MSKTRKTLIALFSVMLMVCVGLFTLTACGGSKQTLDSIRISKQPTKRAYVIGEEFNPAGMEVTAKYVKGDKAGDEKVITDYTVTVDSNYVDASGKFKLADGVTSGRVTITVSYSEKEITKTATTTATVTKPVKDVQIATQPEKTEYYAGEVFDATGLTVNVIYTDDTVEEGVVIVTSGDNANATVDPAGGIPSGTQAVTLTYGGKTFVVNITLLRGVWIEGETGLLNGKYPNQNTTENQGNIGMDAGYDKWTDTKLGAKLSAQELWKAQKRADLALAELTKELGAEKIAALEAQDSELYENENYTGYTVNGKKITALYDAIVEWLADNEEAVETLEASEEYAAEFDAYLESAQYLADVERYHANDDKYLGGVNQGNTVSFVFSSTDNGSGSIAFRLASAYIGANSNWAPALMGDIQFNVLAEVYVNGVAYDIPDSAVLLGGMTPDGSYNNILWVNWQEVQLNNIAFVEGRNVIELKIKEHGITAPGQTTYNWSCNVDSMLILPPELEEGEEADFDLETFDNENFELNATVSKVEYADKEGAATVTVMGTLSGSKGYLYDLVSATVGGTAAEITIDENGNYTAVADVTALDPSEDGYEIEVTVQGESVDATEATYPETELVVGHYTYTFNEDHLLIVTSDAKVEYTSIALEVEGDKVYVILTGTYVTYTEEEIRALVFDMEGADGRKVLTATFAFDTQTVEPEEGAEETAEPATINVFTAKYDVSDKENFPLTAGVNQVYWMHAGMKEEPADLSAEQAKVVADKDKVLVDERFEYSLTDGAEGKSRTLTIKDTKLPVLSVTGVALEDKDGTPVMIIEGSVTNYAEGIEFYLATVHNGNWETPNRSSEIKDSVVWGEADDKGNATFTITWDLKKAKLATGNSYYVHFKLSFTGGNVDLPSKPINKDKMEVIDGNTKYWLKANGDTNSPLVYVEKYDATAPYSSFDNVADFALSEDGNKLYYVIH
ncbi:MAG: bacterial Ig-like domain-containing protein, partial [Clostridia bacterium]|nr:bacterial Ig-like domain-containing protein [Clostridia bacterium]